MFRLERDMREPVGAWLTAHGYLFAFEAFLRHGMADVIAGRFAPRAGYRIPALYEAAVIELKLDDVGGVLRQAVSNRRCVDRSYVAMPADRCERMRLTTLGKFHETGVGLLSVTLDSVEILIEPQRGATADWVTKNLWRRIRKQLAKGSV